MKPRIRLHERRWHDHHRPSDGLPAVLARYWFIDPHDAAWTDPPDLALRTNAHGYPFGCGHSVRSIPAPPRRRLERHAPLVADELGQCERDERPDSYAGAQAAEQAAFIAEADAPDRADYEAAVSQQGRVVFCEWWTIPPRRIERTYLRGWAHPLLDPTR